MKRSNSNLWAIHSSPNKREKCFRLVVGLVLLVFFYSCSTYGSKPEGLLSKDEMATILTELYLKESRINNFHLDQDTAKKLMEYYRYKYAQKTGVPDSLIDLSYQYYLANPSQLSEIYDRVIDTLTLREQKASPLASPKAVE